MLCPLYVHAFVSEKKRFAVHNAVFWGVLSKFYIATGKRSHDSAGALVNKLLTMPSKGNHWHACIFFLGQLFMPLEILQGKCPFHISIAMRVPCKNKCFSWWESVKEAIHGHVMDPCISPISLHPNPAGPCYSSWVTSFWASECPGSSVSQSKGNLLKSTRAASTTDSN